MKNQTQICREIIAKVAGLFGLKAATVTGRLRTRKVVDARFIAMWLCRKKTGLVDRELACLFGKDRGSVTYAIKQVPDWRETDPVFREMFDMASEAIDAGQTISVESKAVEAEVEIPIRNYQVQVIPFLPEGWHFTCDGVGEEPNYPLN